MKFDFDRAELPALSFSPNDLEPILIGEIVQLHHGKHHKEYVDNYNKYAELLASAMHKGEGEKLQCLLDKVHFNAGGHRSHKLYWENLAPIKNGGGILPDEKSQLTKAILESWGSYQHFIDNFITKAHDIRGSGWCWLSFCPDTKKIGIKITEHHDSVTEEGGCPLLVVDVWEHAYYLQYKANKAEYFKNIWKVVNWKSVEQRYLKDLNK